MIQHGLPHHDAITVYGAGAVWTDQQWLAQVFMYGLHNLGGFALLSIATCLSVVGAFAIAAAASRCLGAGARAIWLLFLPVLISAALGWSLRAQMLTLPLYTGLLWLLASEARRPTRRVWWALPVLVLWANMHGSAALGALLVMLLGAYELVASRGRSGLRSVGLVVLAPLAILVTPYGPVTTARYYHLMLVDPPFKGMVTEWNWPAPASNTYAFYVLLAMAVPIVAWGRKRLTLFDIAVLALTLAGALTAIRGIPWFAFACMVFVPVAIGRTLESRKPGEPKRGLNLAISAALATALVLAAGSLFLRSDAWFEDYWTTGRSTPSAATFAQATGFSSPTASPTGCSSRSPSCAGASPTTSASRSTTRRSSPDSATTTGSAATGSRSRTAIASSSSTRRTARTPPTS